jgi:midasin (ATPase involved in ribosome maturation)
VEEEVEWGAVAEDKALEAEAETLDATDLMEDTTDETELAAFEDAEDAEDTEAEEEDATEAELTVVVRREVVVEVSVVVVCALTARAERNNAINVEAENFIFARKMGVGG